MLVFSESWTADMRSEFARCFSVASEIERLAGLHVGASLFGDPVILDDADMAEVHERFPSYGQ